MYTLVVPSLSTKLIENSENRTDSISKTRTNNEEQQKATNYCKKKHAPKTRTSNKEHFSFPFSFICFNFGPIEGG